MGRYRHIENASYQQGVRDTSHALLTLLRSGGQVTYDRDGWAQNLIIVRNAAGEIWSAHHDVALLVFREAVRPIGHHFDTHVDPIDNGIPGAVISHATPPTR